MTAQTAAPEEKPLFQEHTDGIAEIVFDQPKSLNALSDVMIDELQHALDSLKNDRSVKVVVIRSSGKHFCAGHHLKEMTLRRKDTDGGKAYFLDLFQRCARLMQTVLTLPQPVITEVRGIATAAGCQLVAASDLAVAADNARFATSGVNIGLFCSTPMISLSRNVSRKHAMEILLLGEFISAQRAHEIGLINRVVSEDTLSEETHNMAQIIAQKSPAAVKIGKEAFYRQAEMSLKDAYDYAGYVMAENMMTYDAEGGINAFIHKAPMPDWRGE